MQIRLGDALCGKNWDMKQKRPPPPRAVADVIAQRLPKGASVAVMAMPSSHPLNQCKQETKDYLDAVTALLPDYAIALPEVGTNSPQEAADADLCAMVAARVEINP